MTHSSFLLSFLLIFILFFGVISHRIDVSTQYGLTSHEYSQNLTRACQDAVICNAGSEVNHIYDTQAKRERAAYVFHKTLSDGFNMTYDSNSQHALRLHVPVICLIDNDGYYMIYNVIYAGESGRELGQTMTPLNTWAVSGQNQEYNIRYFLTDEVEVTKNTTGEIKRGTYSEVYEYFGRPVGLSLLSEDKYKESKYAFITQDMEDKMEYYINQYNFSVNRLSDGIRSEFDLHYTFVLPEISDADWAGLLSQPSCFAFLQGIKLNNSSRYINVYAMSRGKLIPDKNYYIAETDEGLTYHRRSCIYVGEDSKAYDTRAQCANVGAFPCSVCVP